MIASNKVYLKGINGLRAIAALSVVISHILSPTFGDFGLKNYFKLPLAEFGVTLFFVISGFLITYLLLLEKKNTETVDVRKFYIRRILRIWPIYYLVIFLTILLMICFKSDLKETLVPTLYWYLFFSANIPFILASGIPLLVHFWSIGVEEQFYLIWPWIFKLSLKRKITITILIVSVIFLVKIVAWIFLSNQSVLYRSISVTRIHCMLLGAIGAMYYFNNNIYIFNIINNKWIQLFTWTLFISIGFGLHLPAPIAHEFFAIVSLSLLIGQISQFHNVFSLENDFMNFLGKISYGIYVYHILIIFLLSKLFKDAPIQPILKYPLIYISVITTTIVMSYISYEYFESKFLKSKIKYSVILSSTEPERSI